MHVLEYLCSILLRTLFFPLRILVMHTLYTIDFLSTLFVTEPLNTEGEDEEMGELIVVEEEFVVPDLQTKQPQEPPLVLNELEQKKIEWLMEEFTHSKQPLSPNTQTQLTSLKTLLTRYQELLSKLEQVRFALVSQNKSQIKDELIAYNEVNNPILLVKQYKKENHWFHVPAASYITDQESLLCWLKKTPRHPLNRDHLKKPTPYNQMETRYIWYELTEHYCSSMELNEVVDELRCLLNELIPQLPDPQITNLSISTSAHTFWRTVATDQSSLPKENRVLEYKNLSSQTSSKFF